MDSSKRSRVSRKNARDNVLYALSDGELPECISCGFNDVRALHIDHVEGGGCERARQFKNNRPKYYRSMLDHLEDFQILCANCNAIKLHENREAAKIIYA